MSGRAASLHGRILRAFVVVVVLAVALSVGIGYYVTQRQMDAFVAQLAGVEAGSVARHLGREYAAAGGWATVDRALADAGYLYGGEGEHDEGRGERSERGAETAFHLDRIRIVVVDGGGTVIRDNLSRLRGGTPAPALGGERAAVTDPRTGRAVGYAYVDVEREFLVTELHGFLRAMLATTALGGALIAAVALALAAWISRRITAPVTLLTAAAGKIARRGESSLLPVTSSDELGRMSAAFNRMANALQTQRDLRRRLVDDLAHELNTPLTVIHLEAKGVLDGLQEPKPAAGLIVDEVTKLRNLVRDLNWLAETDSGGLRLDLEPCSVQELLDAERERWQSQARMRGVGLAFEPLPALPALAVDRLRMGQALGNVLANALQHTAPGGRIAVTAEEAPDGGVAIVVRDDGAGIDPADLPHLFERLYRADTSRTRRTGGSGLGLTIARAVVTAHGGTITVASEGPGRGTTVRIRLPAAP